MKETSESSCFVYTYGKKRKEGNAIEKTKYYVKKQKKGSSKREELRGKTKIQVKGRRRSGKKKTHPHL